MVSTHLHALATWLDSWEGAAHQGAYRCPGGLLHMSMRDPQPQPMPPLHGASRFEAAVLCTLRAASALDRPHCEIGTCTSTSPAVSLTAECLAVGHVAVLPLHAALPCLVQRCVGRHAAQAGASSCKLQRYMPSMVAGRRVEAAPTCRQAAPAPGYAAMQNAASPRTCFV